MLKTENRGSFQESFLRLDDFCLELLTKIMKSFLKDKHSPQMLSFSLHCCKVTNLLCSFLSIKRRLGFQTQKLFNNCIRELGRFSSSGSQAGTVRCHYPMRSINRKQTVPNDEHCSHYSFCLEMETLCVRSTVMTCDRKVALAQEYFNIEGLDKSLVT